MDKVAFYHRIDTKFVFHIDILDVLLKDIENDYFMLEMDNKRCFSYSSVYYDTPEIKMYLDHIRGKKNRYKIRHRRYNDSGLSFIEVKFKKNSGKTYKWRNADPFPENEITELDNRLLAGQHPFETESLKPVLKTQFQRITLVDKSYTQRITIDFDIVFTELGNSKKTEKLSDIVILEIKSDRNKATNGIQRTLKKYGIIASGFSKYCMGVALTNTCTKKTGALKPNILRIHKIRKNAVKHTLAASGG
jgi:inorganic triphosphatase YgiF